MKKLRLQRYILTIAAFASLAACDSSGGGGTGKNEDNSFAMVTSWTSNGLVNHYNSNTGCEAFNYFVIEGLYRYVRSTDEIYCQLAKELPVHVTKTMSDYKEVMGMDAYNYYVGLGATTVKVTQVEIREGAKWQNGEAFTAKDVWSYYYMIHPTSSNYMAGVKVVDDTHLEFVWSPIKEPVDKVKELLLAQDKNGTIKYDEFQRFIDPVYDIVMASPVNTNQNLWGAFNRFSTDAQITQMNIVRNAFYAYSPSWYIATGPFKLSTFSATQIKLTKNEYFWNADNIGFDTIKLYSSQELNQTYSLIENGMCHYYDGFIQADTLQSILDNNPDIVNLKMYDPGAIGLNFNIKRSTFKNINIRKAFQYIFDRDEVRLAANPFGKTSYYPIIGMAPSEAKRYMSKTNYDALPKGEYNQTKAAQLLETEGWSKVQGKWTDAQGSPVEINLAAPSGHDVSSTAAEAVAAQLTAFGIKTNLLKTSSFYGNAEADNSNYDICLEWTDLNMSFSYPTGSYTQWANLYSRWIKVDRYPNNSADVQKAGQPKLFFSGLGEDTKTYEFADYLNSFYSVPEEELQYLVDVFNTGLADMCLGIQLFQNVTAATYNVGYIKGIPFEDRWSVNSNVDYVPEVDTEDFFTMARTNLPFAGEYNIINGLYQPNCK